MTQKHVHISLVGAEPIPVYQGIIYEDADLVFLICSSSTHRVAENVKAQLPELGDNVIIRDLSATDFGEMVGLANEVASLLASDTEVSLNLSGGANQWKLVFNNIFRELLPLARVYCLGQDRTVYDVTRMVATEKVPMLDTDRQIALQGQYMDSYTSFSDYTNEDLSAMRIIMRWGVLPKYHEALKRLTMEFAKRAQGDSSQPLTVSHGNDSLAWNPDTQTFTGWLVDSTIDLTSPHLWHLMLNTGWFEVYVASRLAEFYPAEEIRLNCIFRTNGTGNVKNEIDIIVNTGPKLLFVECKTQVYGSIDVDKFASAVQNYGGRGSKALFVTNTPIQDDAREKCRDKRIDIYHTYHPELATHELRRDDMAQMLQRVTGMGNA